MNVLTRYAGAQLQRLAGRGVTQIAVGPDGMSPSAQFSAIVAPHEQQNFGLLHPSRPQGFSLAPADD